MGLGEVSRSRSMMAGKADHAPGAVGGGRPVLELRLSGLGNAASPGTAGRLARGARVEERTRPVKAKAFLAFVQPCRFP